MQRQVVWGRGGVSSDLCAGFTLSDLLLSGVLRGLWRKKRIRMALWTIGSVLSEQVYWNFHVERA